MIPSEVRPTAQMSVGETAAAPYSSLVYGLGLGLSTMVHAEPSQCWIIVLSAVRVS